MTLELTLVGGQELQAKFTQAAQGAMQAVQEGVQRGCLIVQKCSKEKLSDDVLHVRTGRLRRSINVALTASGNAVVGSVGTNVAYAGVHEFGFDGTVTVRAHLRLAKSGKAVPVREHPMHMHMPERSYLRSALQEMAPDVREAIQTAVMAKLQTT
jgi:phage gpG-like protein